MKKNLLDSVISVEVGQEIAAEIERRERRAEFARRAYWLGLRPEQLAERVWLKRRARQIGLAYWPALRERGVDPRAFVIAEQVLAPHAGVWGTYAQDGYKSHGPWDSYGYRGLTPGEVARLWRICGCRDSAKYRFVLRVVWRARQQGLGWVGGRESSDVVGWGFDPRKGDSLDFLCAYARGARWLAHQWDGANIWRFSRKATAAIGRLSPELRVAAIKGVCLDDLDDEAIIRIRDLNWPEVVRVQRMLAEASPERAAIIRAALSGTRRAAAILGIAVPQEPSRREMREVRRQIADAICPAYPGIPLRFARRLALGERPVDLANGQLTKAEAHAWLRAGAPLDVVDWYCQRHGLPVVRSWRVAKWLLAIRQAGRWAAIEREREARLPGGETRTFRALDVLDEVMDEDIRTGRDSVSAVLERAARRLGEEQLQAALDDHRQLAPLPAWASRLPRWVRILRTPAALAREGEAMHHCVGGYASAVERGQCHILAVRSRHGCSTVEVRPSTLTIVQHKGPYNGEPPRRHVVLVQALLSRLRRGGSDRLAA
jgi:hypothetical protein